MDRTANASARRQRKVAATMKTIIGAALAIVLLASQAAAQSVWVWWIAAGNTFDPVAAYATKQECESALSVYEQRRKPLYKDDKVYRMLEGNRLSVIASVEGKEFITVHWCLPETIDPRGAKGK